MNNYEVFQKNPLYFNLINNGVSRVGEIVTEEQLKTLRFELETFVCDGEYANGIDRILTAYLDGLKKPEQQAAWVSGFFGSGKSHLVKMLRFLWEDYKFPDGASARSIAQMPETTKELLIELTSTARRYGGLRAAAGTLGAGNMDNVRLAFLQVVFRAANLPENLAGAKLVLWLKEKQLWEKVTGILQNKKLDVDKEIRNFYVSIPLAEALVAADSSFGTTKNTQEAIRSQFPNNMSPTMDDVVLIIKSIFSVDGKMPCTLIAVDEIQQYIGDKVQRAMDVQEIAEYCCKNFSSRLLLVGTGQFALTGTHSLSRLQARFTIKVPLSDTDVENVVRKTVLAKKPERMQDIKKVITDNQGEISRQLHTTRLAATPADDNFYTADYPLLPVRLRFWEKVLRNVDKSGTTAQLRTQLKIIFEAARQSAEKPLGNVVPADFIYDQIAIDLLNTGVLLNEHHQSVLGFRDGTSSGDLKSRLCALLFLISQLPRSAGADDGVRANPETLADLLVEDLKNDGSNLRQSIPNLLADLVAQGKVMQIESEYMLQTREGTRWTHEYQKYYAQYFKDDILLGEERESALKESLQGVVHGLTLNHGVSKQPRKLEAVISSSAPTQPNDSLVLWVRHAWSDQEKTVEADARAASNNSPMLFGFLPRLAHDELKQHLASKLAADQTLSIFGTPSEPPEAVQACNSIKTALQNAETGIAECIARILAGAKIYLGGGSEVPGLELVDKIKKAAEASLQRLFIEFSAADYSGWATVFIQARAGNIGALQAIGYQGEAVRQPALKKIYDVIGAGKKGKEIRDNFKLSPFGWPQDAIDASLVILTLSGNLRVTINGLPASAKELTQINISNASFQVDIPPLTVLQRLDLKALFQKLEITTQNGQESAAAAVFLNKLLGLAESAGGEPPLPEKPNCKNIKELQTLSGNAQLLEIHKAKDKLAVTMTEWKKSKDTIEKRLPPLGPAKGISFSRIRFAGS